jgi:hypothetical protein
MVNQDSLGGGGGGAEDCSLIVNHLLTKALPVQAAMYPAKYHSENLWSTMR